MLHVVIGIIFNSEQKVLIAQRQSHQEKGGLWEFPGGKVEPDESSLDALKREFKEELNIDLLSASSWLKFSYEYADKKIFLDIWMVEKYEGTVIGAEGQPIRWVAISELDQYTFPGGNVRILTELKKL